MSTTYRKIVSYWMLLLALLVLMPGCKAWRIDKEAIKPPSTDEIRLSRPLDPTTKSFGLSSKAREIERSMGIE